VLLGVNASIPTGSDVITQYWFLASDPTTQADCDASAPQNAVFVADTPNRCESTFLRNAHELATTGNGLCESDETCLFLPHIGAYQGAGDLVAAGEFVGGGVSGVTLQAYAQ